MKFLRIFPGNVREHLVLVFQLHPKHRVGQRLNHGGHHFDGVFLRIGRVGLALFRLGSSCPCALSRPLPRRSLHFAGTRQNPGSIRGHRDGVLKMRRLRAVGRHRCPIVVKHAHIRSADIHHGLDREDHAFLQARAAARFAVIQHVGLFMNVRPDSVAAQIAHHRVAVLASRPTPARRPKCPTSRFPTRTFSIARSRDSRVTCKSFCNSGVISPTGTVTAASA